MAEKELEMQDAKAQMTYCIDKLKAKLQEEKDSNRAILLEKQHLAAQVLQTKDALDSECKKRAELEAKIAELKREEFSLSVAHSNHCSNGLYALEVQELRQQLKNLQPLVVQKKALEKKSRTTRISL